MKFKQIISHCTAAALCLILLMPSAAQALTPAQALELLEAYYIDELPAAVYEQTTISGMINVLGDPYTEYLPAKQYDTFMGTMSDSTLIGIGIVYTTEADGLYIKSVNPGSAAEKGGLHSGDIIIRVDDHSTKGVTAAESSSWIQGEEGSTVNITYVREGAEVTVSLIRAVVVVPATTAELIDDHICYIKCTTFGDETVGYFKDAIEKYTDTTTCWIVDLRNNSGGITTAATEAAGLFVGPKRIAYLRDGDDQYSIYMHGDESLTVAPVIVLMNSRSASATEIFAAAIQGSESGIVIGDRSFGKGVAQTIWDNKNLPDYFPDGDAMKITSYRFFSYLGNTTDQIGVIPNIWVHPDDALDLACLLAGAANGIHADHTLRVDLGYGHPWRWFIDLDTAAAEENKPYLELLLNDLPPDTPIWFREFKTDDWTCVTAEDICSTYGLTFYDVSFPDADASDFPAAIDTLRYYGLVSGKEDGAYHPKDLLTRAELCQLLAEALSCTVPDNPCPFTDVAEDAWYTSAITAISNIGLVNGMEDGTFHPEEPVDHQQFLTIMGRLVRWLNMYFYNKAQKIPEDALDSPTLADYAEWARPSVWLLTESQRTVFDSSISLLWDRLENIPPHENTTRDEAANTFCTILIYTGVLPG